VYAPESLTLCCVRSQITDQCGLSGIVAKLLDRRLIIPHGLALSGGWVVDPTLLFSPSALSARDALRSSSSFSAPGGRSAASSRAVLANDARRSCSGSCWLKLRRLIMTRSFPFQRKAGAQPAFASPIRAKDSAVMQDQRPSSNSVPGPAPIGRQGTLEGVRNRGDRATLPIEEIWSEKIRGCSCRYAVPLKRIKTT